MRIQQFAGIAFSAVLLAGAQPTHADVIAPKSINEFQLDDTDLRELIIGREYEFDIPVRLCFEKRDLDELISVEMRGSDPEQLYKQKRGCGIVQTPQMMLFDNLGSFAMHDGTRFWYMEMRSDDKKLSVFIVVPYEWFVPSEN
jgi:hypothetical protein